jgi:hypothetical protein
MSRPSWPGGGCRDGLAQTADTACLPVNPLQNTPLPVPPCCANPAFRPKRGRCGDAPVIDVMGFVGPVAAVMFDVNRVDQRVSGRPAADHNAEDAADGSEQAAV